MLTRYPALASGTVPAGLAAVRFKGPHGPVMPVVVAAAVLIIAAVVYAVRRSRRRRPLPAPGERNQAPGGSEGQPWR